MVSVLSGCNQRITPPTAAAYSAFGAVVKNLDDSILATKIVFNKNDTAVSKAQIKIGNDTLHFDSGTYSKIYDSLGALPTGSFRLRLKDSTGFADSVLFSMPDTFSISSIAPNTRVYTSATERVRVEFTTSAGSNGYAFGVVKADSAYKIAGFFNFVTTGATSVTVPREAFLDINSNLDTGWYYIYIYAFSGSPVPISGLPTGFPVGLTPNIVHLNLNGSWGAVVVAKRDSMQVQAL